MNCYIESICNAKHFIYIENQFFVGNTAGEGVYNKIPNAIVERILRAHSQREAFRVIIIIPVHPNGDYSHAMKAKVVMHYEYATINRCLESMFTQLKFRAPAINISDYIDFFSLRNWGIINNKVVSEQIYVHDKLIIVDDRVLIIGSANINDRSMLGNRDSELAVRIEDAAHMDIRMNGNLFTVGCVPHRLRVKLMKQHLQCNDSIGEVKIRDTDSASQQYCVVSPSLP
jgi:phospholipase D1/2